MIKTVFIDLDDTVLDFKKAENRAIRRTLCAFGKDASDELCALYSQINMLMWKSLERGEITRDELRISRFCRFFKEADIDAAPEQGAHIYEGFLSQGHFFIDGAEDMLKKLHKKYDLYLASNGIASTQRGRIASAGIAGYFKDMFISENIGFSKPDKRYFEACFRLIPDFSREHAVIIGDSLSSDILGGKNAGIKTVWYAPNGGLDTLPDYTITELKDAEALLESI